MAAELSKLSDLPPARPHKSAPVAELINIVPGRSAELVFCDTPCFSACWKNTIEALLSEAFETHRVERVAAFVDSAESAALRVLNRSGFQFQRTQWSNPSRDPFHIVLVHELTRSRWSSRTAGKPNVWTSLTASLKNIGVRVGFGP